MPRLAVGNQALDGSRDILNRDLGIHPVLVDEVDGVDSEPTKRALDRASDVFGTAGNSSVLARTGSISKPNLVAITTWSRTGRSASPTTSSLVNGP